MSTSTYSRKGSNGSINHNANDKPPRRKRRVVGQDVTLKRTFYVWVLVAACVFMIVHQFHQTKKVVRQLKKDKDKELVSPLDFLQGQQQQNQLQQSNDPPEKKEEDEDDVFMDDDNQYDDSVDDDDDDKDNNSLENNGDDPDEEPEDNDEENAGDADDTSPDKDLDAYVKKLRAKMEKEAELNGGKVSSGQYIELYEKAVARRKRKDGGKQKTSRLSIAGVLLGAVNNTGKKADAVTKLSRQERKELKRSRYSTNKNWRPPPLNSTSYGVVPEESRMLPNMNTENGGVIFFLHVPKTGGQTVRQFNLRFRKHLERQAAHHRRRQMGLPLGRIQLEEQEPPTTELMELDVLAKERLRFVVANTLVVFHQQAVPQVNYFLESPENTQGKILFVEVHGMDNHNAFELEPYLRYWRHASTQSGVPFFAFTLAREALSLQVSFFNYYYIHPGDPRFCINPLKPSQKCGSWGTGFGGGGLQDKKRQRQQMREEYMKRRGMADARLEGKGMESDQMDDFTLREFMKMHLPGAKRGRHTENHAEGMKDVSHEQMEKAMLEVAYKNPQCLFLARGERTFGDGPDERRLRDVGMRRNECQQAYMSLQRTMDWIGRTDTLSTETLPLLTHMMFGKPHLGKHLPKANVSPTGGFVKLSQMQPSNLKGLEQLSQFDQEIYHRIKEDYTMDQWLNKTDYS